MADIPVDPPVSSSSAPDIRHQLAQFKASQPTTDQPTNADIDGVAVSSSSVADLWQPIDTAPPTSGHGLHVLLYVPRFGLGSLIVEGWVNAAINGSPWVAHNGGQIEPTHWQMLPDPPTASVSHQQTNRSER